MNSHPSIPPISDAPELCRIDVAALSAAFGSGALSPVEVAEATLARAEEAQSRFNAFTFIDRDGALQPASAPRQRARPAGRRRDR